jgi:hypothetical protein
MSAHGKMWARRSRPLPAGKPRTGIPPPTAKTHRALPPSRAVAATISNYEGLGSAARFWSAEEGIGNTYDAYHWTLTEDMLYFDAGYKNEGGSVRCVKNN